MLRTSSARRRGRKMGFVGFGVFILLDSLLHAGLLALTNG